MFRLAILRLCIPYTLVKLFLGIALLYILYYLISRSLGELSSDLRSAERAVGACDIKIFNFWWFSNLKSFYNSASLIEFSSSFLNIYFNKSWFYFSTSRCCSAICSRVFNFCCVSLWCWVNDFLVSYNCYCKSDISGFYCISSTKCKAWTISNISAYLPTSPRDEY